MDERRAALLEDTVKFWQQHTSRRFTAEDARAAIENMAGFFATLHRWSVTSRSSDPDSTSDEEAA